MRNAQKELAVVNLENEALKTIIRGEKELREDRNVEETNALITVHEDLKSNVLVNEEEKRKIKKQREFVDNQV